MRPQTALTLCRELDTSKSPLMGVIDTRACSSSLRYPVTSALPIVCEMEQ